MIGTLLDMSRVQSGALPRSLLPSKVLCSHDDNNIGREERERDLRSSPLLEMLSDAQSFHACGTDDVDCLDSPEDSPSVPGGLNVTADHALRVTAVAGDVPPVSSSRQRATEDGAEDGAPTRSGTRPMSAPHRTTMAATSGLAGSGRETSGGQGLPDYSVEAGRLREKRKSLDIERQRRLMNIQESARAAMQYSAQRQSSNSTSKAETLPRDSRTSASSSATSLGRSVLSAASDNDLPTVAAAHLPPYRLLEKSSSPSSSSSSSSSPHHATSTTPRHQPTAAAASSEATPTTTTPLNLQHLSMEQTREACLTQMDEIWKQVEAIGGNTAPSNRGGGASITSGPTAPPPLSSHVVDHVPASLISDTDERGTGESGSEVGMVGVGSAEALESRWKEESDILKESDVTISLLEPVSRSTPLRPEGVAGGGASKVGGAESLLVELSRSDNGTSRKNRPTSFSNRG